MKGKKLLELKAVARLVGRPEFSLFTVKLFVGSSSKPELFMPNLEGLHRQCIAATLKEKKNDVNQIVTCLLRGLVREGVGQ